jgi:hypothetical protein
MDIRRAFSGNTAAAGRVVLNKRSSSHQPFLSQALLPMLLALVPNPPVCKSLRWWLQVLDAVIIGMGGRRRLFSGKRDDIYTCACCFDSKYVHWV